MSALVKGANIAEPCGGFEGGPSGVSASPQRALFAPAYGKVPSGVS